MLEKLGPRVREDDMIIAAIRRFATLARGDPIWTSRWTNPPAPDASAYKIGSVQSQIASTQQPLSTFTPLRSK
ncbi:hypothetical protein CR103_12480 [Massilia psychrophila]|uniref:Uncharacterized protein n=1 Tax=Massilia psychrophila TaxID=1603353 RepID=A0A2G8T079_9BURK|nr:hypothetical protein CR103_12480 [Massilia psychrophila]GGE76513.1 hypothetical protein GCM10008020_21560 [Massilia psychrophila]